MAPRATGRFRAIPSWYSRSTSSGCNSPPTEPGDSAPSLPALVFEGDLDLGPVALDLAVLEGHVERGDFGDPEITQALRGEADRRGGGLFPRLRAGSDELDDLVDALRHDALLESGCDGLPPPRGVG